MYNDEQNLYHYTYRKDGTEDSGYTQATQTPVPSIPVLQPTKKNRWGLKITALALSCALLGGAAGAGIMWSAGHGGNTDIQISARMPATVTQVKVDGKTQMTEAQVYAAGVDSVVSINSATSSNVFGQKVEGASAGSGFIISKEGFIVTNYHVIADATKVKVTLYSGDTLDATIIGGDEEYDIAVLQVQADNLRPVVLGNSAGLLVGDHVMAVGNPLGELTFSMSSGIVSSVNRAINVDGTPFNMIQVDASINPGNSGGPLFNSYGEVVGIVSAKYTQYANNSVEGLGFAIPMNDVLAMIQDIMTNGYVTNKAYLDITAGTVDATMAAQTGLTQGVYIYAVTEGGAAAKAGLQAGDVIVKVGDKKISSLVDLNAAKKGHVAGDKASFTINRGGKTQTVEVTFAAAPAKKEEPVQQPPVQQQPQDGYNGYSGDMDDFFNYFFGTANPYGGTGNAA
ncbi:MAG: trypsin-like peptidase domain-containing protein [Oscillospiraceae bacterium]